MFMCGYLYGINKQIFLISFKYYIWENNIKFIISINLKIYRGKDN